MSDQPTNVVNFSRTTSEVLDCVLTEDEQRERGQQLAESVKAVSDLERDQKDVKASMKEAMEDAEAERERLALIVRDGKEPRTVPVRLDYDDQRGMVHKTRLDTGELIGTRPMTDEEKQRALPFLGRKVN